MECTLSGTMGVQGQQPDSVTWRVSDSALSKSSDVGWACCSPVMPADPGSMESQQPSVSNSIFFLPEDPWALWKEKEGQLSCRCCCPPPFSLVMFLEVPEGVGHMSCRQHTYFMPLEFGFLQLSPDGPFCCQATAISRGILSRRICVKHCVVLPLPDLDFRLPPTRWKLLSP